MATLTLDFLHNYRSGERRATDPENAYQYDEGHVLEAVLPAAVETCELHYWLPGIVEAETFATNTITQNTDGTTQ